MNSSKLWAAENTNFDLIQGSLNEAIAGADVFIGVSGPQALTVRHIQRMAHDPIVFALANPDPEIAPEDAQQYVRVMATGRSDYANQINNVLCFPGFFRGLLDVRAQKVVPEMKVAAAEAIADVISENDLRPDYIIPSVFDRRVVQAVATAVSQAAIQTGAAMHTEVHGRIERAQTELTLHRGGVNSSAIVDSLWAGLTTLRKLFLARLHADRESLPEAKWKFRRAAEEIEIYSLLVVVAEVEHSRYTNGDLAWFRDWLLQLRFGDAVDPALVESIRRYDQQNDGQRRRMFSSFLEQAFPEARKAPLIIYRLLPRAVRIVTALAFGDALRAREVRGEQISYLPIIGDCHYCHGLPLENGETCVECGNPLWKIKWLNAME